MPRISAFHSSEIQLIWKQPYPQTGPGLCAVQELTSPVKVRLKLRTRLDSKAQIHRLSVYLRVETCQTGNAQMHSPALVFQWNEAYMSLHNKSTLLCLWVTQHYQLTVCHMIYPSMNHTCDSSQHYDTKPTGSLSENGKNVRVAGMTFKAYIAQNHCLN